VKLAAMNAKSMTMIIAKNVPKPALNAQKNAGKWHPKPRGTSNPCWFFLCTKRNWQWLKLRESALPENRLRGQIR